MTFTLDERQIACGKEEFVFWFAGSRLGELSFSKNFRATWLFVEDSFMINNVPDQQWGIDATLYSRQYPVKQLDNPEDRRRVLTNFDRLNDRFGDTDHRFYEEVLRLQMRLFILEMWHTFANEYERRKRTVQSGTLYERFIHLLEAHCLRQRKVQFYADHLHVSAKHLNFICKQNSGITASAWIQRYARDRIVILLQNDNLNIAEIADEMAFSSRSFFTRYVKKLLGMTPTQFRNRLD